MILAPDVAVVSRQIANNFLTSNYLTIYAQSFLNTVLHPLDPKPDWFDQIDSSLDNAHSIMSQWILKDGPSVASGLPQAFIDYADSFLAAAGSIQTLVGEAEKNSGKTPTDQQRSSLLALLGRLSDEAQAQKTRVADLQTLMSTFSDQVRSQQSSLSQDIAAISATVTADQQDIQMLQAQIAQLQQKLATVTANAKNASSGAAISAVQLVLTLLTATIAVAVTEGAAIPFLSIAGGFLSTGEKSVEDFIDDAKILDDLKAISNLQLKMTAEQQQVVSLQAIINTLDSLQTQNEQATNSVFSFSPIWDDVYDQLQSPIEALDQPSVDVSLISTLNNIQDASISWTTISTQATNIQESAIKMAQPVTLKAPSTTSRSSQSARP